MEDTTKTLQQSDLEDDSQPVLNFQPVKRNFHSDCLDNGVHNRWHVPDSLRNTCIGINSRRKVTVNGQIKGISTGYIDQDTSGDYDPLHEKGPFPRHRKPRPPPTLDENGQPLPRRVVKKAEPYIIVLKLKSKEGLQYLKSIPSGISGTRPKDDGLGIILTEKRKTKIHSYTNYRSDGLTISDLTVGHPQRRGCVCCFEEENDECTLIDDSDEYPCETCEENGVGCQYINPPEYKKSCERCKGKRIPCSYRDDGGKGLDKCDACAEADVGCCAGPYLGSLAKFSKASSRSSTESRTLSGTPSATRLSTASSPQQSSEESNDESLPAISNVGTGKPVPAGWVRIIACSQCRGHGLRCSINSRESLGPCKECRKTGDTCRFQHKPGPELVAAELAKAEEAARRKEVRGTRVNGIGRTRNSHKRNSKTNPSSGPRLVGRTSGIEHKHISTFFCHPLKFNYNPDLNNQYPCSWCASPVFGLYGLGLKENVEVIPWGGEIGNEELEGGHAQDGSSNTRMCVGCTTDRISIIMCDGHKPRKLQVADPQLLDVHYIEQAIMGLGALHEDEKVREFITALKWCSICVAPAVYACCTPTYLGERGCGLLLCITCFDILERVIKGLTAFSKTSVLDECIKTWKHEAWGRNDGEIRADVEFLTSGGDLKKWIESGNGRCSWDDSRETGMRNGRNDEIVGGVSVVKGKGKEKWNGMSEDAKGWKPESFFGPALQPAPSRSSSVSSTSKRIKTDARSRRLGRSVGSPSRRSPYPRAKATTPTRGNYFAPGEIIELSD